MSQIKVLVVDDSAFMRKIISDVINSQDNLKVIDTAKNGKEAIDKIKNLKPNVVTLDIEMPVLDGLSALEMIMKRNPVPVIMLSSLTKEGADATIKALQLGAVDFITKPISIFKISAADMKKQLIDKVYIASKVKFKSKLYNVNKPLYFENNYKTPSYKINPENKSIKKIIAIVTSTGGPRALQTLIPSIPKNIDASIVIVQHMPPGFTRSLAERLDNISQISVKEGEDNDILLPGHAYIAPGGYHMRVIRESNNYKLKLSKDAPVLGHRPSVNVLMSSIAELGSQKVIGVILTGMGSDGAEALKYIKNNSGYIIAQDEESCVVFGMPKAAIKLGIVDKVLPIEKIGQEIIKAMEV